MDGAFTVWSGLFYFLLGASFSIFTCTYIVLGAGLNRGWRDSLFVAFCFCFCFFFVFQVGWEETGWWVFDETG